MDAVGAPTTTRAPLRRAWYGASVAEFLTKTENAISGELLSNSDFAVLPSQRDAWFDQIRILQGCLQGLRGSVYLEFNIPRMGRRVDAILVIGPIVFVVEFKVGEDTFEQAAAEQVWDYALDLKNFHEASHAVSLVPILVATDCRVAQALHLKADEDGVFRPVCVSTAELRPTIDSALSVVKGCSLDAEEWACGSYRPTPTIVEAARALYAHHSVEAIARFDAGAQNLCITSRRVEEIVEQARKERRKVICFVTGVPGAGKTLVGLNIATRRREESQPTHAVFLSGNDPLVAVLREALTRDEVSRRKRQGERVTKNKVGERVKTFIQNVRHFRDDALIDINPPVEHVAIFDEAQRAWNHTMLKDFMQRKRKLAGFTQSEPEFLIECMDRHKDWAAVICLVGGGQEIHRGEAGIKAWLEAVSTRFEGWHAYISSKLTDTEYAAGEALEVVSRWPNAHYDDSLHLAVSMRSFRAEHVSAFVKALLDCRKEEARRAYHQLGGRYPIVLTRDLSLAKNWVRSHARGTERYGLIASSKAQRLKPHAIDIRVNVDPVQWFLNDRADTRSSYYLEDAATEFQVQGLELDWTCVTWDGDLRFTGSGWTYHDFRGDRWCNINKLENREYLRNAYRVLLTRARQGMVVFVPPGDRNDPTRLPSFYDSTFSFLQESGIPALT